MDDVINPNQEIYSRAPYYLNNVFDQLKGKNDFMTFYGYLQRDVPFVFTLPAYITGVLSFYAGLLIRKAIKKQNLENVKEIHLRYYGKEDVCSNGCSTYMKKRQNLSYVKH